MKKLIVILLLLFSMIAACTYSVFAANGVAGIDKVVVLSEGYVAEQGSPKELMAQEGMYKRMVELQKKSGNWVLNN